MEGIGGNQRAGSDDGCVIVSGGFAVVNPNSNLSINAVEAYPIDQFSAENVRNLLAEAQKVATGSGSEQDIAEAKVEIEVWDLEIASCKMGLLTAVTGPRGPPGCSQVSGLCAEF